MWDHFHLDDKSSDGRIINSDSSWKIETLIFFNIKFNNNDNRLSGLAYVSRNDVVVLDKFAAKEVSILCFKKHVFSERTFFLLKQSFWMQEVVQMLQFLLAVNSIDIVTGDFSYDLLNVSENKLLSQIMHKG